MTSRRHRSPVICPYCGQTQHVLVEEGEYRPFIWLCDPELGGCDHYFAVIGRVKITVTADAHAIEGQGPPPDTPEEQQLDIGDDQF